MIAIESTDRGPLRKIRGSNHKGLAFIRQLASPLQKSNPNRAEHLSVGQDAMSLYDVGKVVSFIKNDIVNTWAFHVDGPLDLEVCWLRARSVRIDPERTASDGETPNFSLICWRANIDVPTPVQHYVCNSRVQEKYPLLNGPQDVSLNTFDPGVIEYYQTLAV